MKDTLLRILCITTSFIVWIVSFVGICFAELFVLFAFKVLPGNPPLNGIELVLTLSFFVIISSQCSLWLSEKTLEFFINKF